MRGPWRDVKGVGVTSGKPTATPLVEYPGGARQEGGDNNKGRLKRKKERKFDELVTNIAVQQAKARKG